MTLTDVMSHSGHTIYAIVALVLFVVAFCAIAWRTFARGRRDEMERNRHLPFDDGTETPAGRGVTR